MLTKLKTLKSTICFIIMALLYLSCILICYVISFFDKKAYDELWDLMENKESKFKK